MHRLPVNIRQVYVYNINTPTLVTFILILNIFIIMSPTLVTFILILNIFIIMSPTLVTFKINISNLNIISIFYLLVSFMDYVMNYVDYYIIVEIDVLDYWIS